MDKLIQYPTRASLYNGEFGGEAGWPAAGMGYVYVIDEARAVVVDGGHGEDAEDLPALLRKATGKDIPTVDLWIITHPHLDHYGAIRELASREDLRGRVLIGEIMWYFPAEFRDRNGNAVCVKANGHMAEIREALGAAAHHPVEGERITVGGLELTVLFVPFHCGGLTNPNSLSLIFTVKSHRKTVMMTGDACPVTMGYCVKRYGTTLKSDVLQLPHHGLCDTGNAEFYRLVGAKTLLIPISEAGDRAMRSGMYGEATAVNSVADELAAEVYRAYEGYREIEL